MATAPASRTARPRPSNEQLAKQLMDCALLVKRGQKSPLLNQTIHDLMEFMATENGDASPRQQHQHHPKHSSSSNRQEGTVSKPTKPPALAMLGKMVAGVTSSTTDTTTSHRSEASKRATSSKNAARVKADLQQQQQQQLQQHHGNAGKSTWYAGHHEEAEWCEEHFCMGCACKGGKNKPNLPAAAAQRSPNAPPSPTRSTTSSVTTSHTTSLKTKPPFQRPTNPKSSLIANGWIEQQRRSKMRTVWKDVLASLVEGRKPGEETTLWIQRQITDTSTGKPKLEALHQIPCKWIQDVTLEQYSADNKFTLKVYNLTDEFVFRCPNSEDAAQNWVLTLLSLKELTQQKPGKTTTTTTTKTNEPRNAVDEWENENKVHSRQQQEQRSSFEDEKKSDTSHQAYPQRPAPPTILRDAGSTGSGGGRISVHELRAIAHGAGISTVGMERGELEAVVAKLASGAMNNVAQPSAPPVPPPPPPPPPPQPDPEEMERRRQEEIARMKQKTMEEKARAQQPFDEETDEIHKEEILKRKAAEEEATARRRAAEEEAARRRAEEEAARRRAEEEATRRRAEEEEARRQAEEEARKAREAEEEHRRRIAERVHQQQREAMLRKEEEERKRLEAERLQREEEEHRRRVAEVKAAEERRRQEEMLRQQQQKWQQQQQQWQQQQAEEAKRAAEEQRRREEMLRQQQQQWQQQQHAAQQQHWQQQQHPAPPHQHWQQQHVPPQGFQGHPNHQRFPHPPQQPQPHNAQHPYSPPPPNTGSPINMKYAQMAHQTENQNAMSEQGIKHAVLVEWALQPPMLQVLRPIEVLISSIHTVFPPRFGVQPHEYFSKWKGLSLGDVTLGPSEGNRPDAKKLERAKKKLQLFLHTDKLPKDFSAQQLFLCRLLWDISNDAWNEYKTKEEELGWMR